MPFTPLTEIDPEKAREATRRVCEVFGVPSLRDFQEQAGHNTLKGRNTILDVPTGGGKTLAFYYPLFYYWSQNTSDSKNQKIILIISPLVGLMESQAKVLTDRGIPAVAMTSVTKDLDKVLKDFGNNQYRVGFVGPEMAASSHFHKLVVESSPFQRNIIAVDVDEGHEISEWGTDDFRPEYSRLSQLLAKLPSGVPVLTASATLPPEIIQDIESKLGLGDKCERISVSNEKPNVALSVRIIQHPLDSFADLAALFPIDPTGPEDFAQTIIYVNSRHDAELIQDFFRKNCPDCIPKESFEFFHRYIAESDKIAVQEGLASGQLRCVIATDALGTGMDFRKVQRVILWGDPRTFNSLIQKIGRCVRVFTELGEAILFITQAAYKKHAAEFESGLSGDGSAPEWEPVGTSGGDESEDEIDEVPDLDEVNDEDEGEEDEENVGGLAVSICLPVTAPCNQVRRVKRRKFRTFIEARDQWFLAWFIITESCRRIPWNKFYGNDSKFKLPFVIKPPGARCCDNCEPDQFPVESIRLTDPSHLQTSGRLRKSSPELFDAVRAALRHLREEIVYSEFGPDEHQITGKAIIQDEIVETLAERARNITSIEALAQRVRWHFTALYGNTVVDVICKVVAQFPDSVEQAREERNQGRAFNTLITMAKKDFRSKLSQVSDECFKVVEGQSRIDGSGKLYKVCQPFMTLPRRNLHPGYYSENGRYVSLSNIRAAVKRGTVYSSVSTYVADWHCMFENARRYNEDESQIYMDTNALEQIFNQTLEVEARKHGLSMPEPDDIEIDP